MRRQVLKLIAVLVIISVSTRMYLYRKHMSPTLPHENPLHQIVKRPVLSRPNPNGPIPFHKPKVVLFTSFSNRKDKLFVYHNTIRNWASFLPHIQPVLFTTFPSGPVIDLAQKHGWLVAPNPSTNIFGCPFLKDMYLAAFDLFSATLYGYANGDILFDQGLNHTLHKVIANINFLNTSLLFGTRRNYHISAESSYEDHPLWPPARIAELSDDNHTELFRYDAFDYFFITRDFPFTNFLPLVIGRSGFDTYFTAFATMHGLSTIEGTGSITALHQTDHDGNFAHEKHKNVTDTRYNRILIGDYFNYVYGYAENSRYGSAKRKDGTVYLECRNRSLFEILSCYCYILGVCKSPDPCTCIL